MRGRAWVGLSIVARRRRMCRSIYSFLSLYIYILWFTTTTKESVRLYKAVRMSCYGGAPANHDLNIQRTHVHL